MQDDVTVALTRSARDLATYNVKDDQDEDFVKLRQAAMEYLQRQSKEDRP